jgi:SAM-dependent methyltransferase
MTLSSPNRLNIGCGHEPRSGWVNLDVAPLPGVDVVHDLDRIPWPFADGSFTEIEMINVLEHLPDTMVAMAELYRILSPGGRVTIRVPYWNSPAAVADPTHKKMFNEETFDFFDPMTRHGRVRSYYGSVRFAIVRMDFYTGLSNGLPFLKVTLQPFKALLVLVARFFGGIIWAEEVVLQKRAAE